MIKHKIKRAKKYIFYIKIKSIEKVISDIKMNNKSRTVIFARYIFAPMKGGILSFYAEKDLGELAQYFLSHKI